MITQFTSHQTTTLPKWMIFQKLFFKSSLLLNGYSAAFKYIPQTAATIFAFGSVCFFYYEARESGPGWHWLAKKSGGPVSLRKHHAVCRHFGTGESFALWRHFGHHWLHMGRSSIVHPTKPPVSDKAVDCAVWGQGLEAGKNYFHFYFVTLILWLTVFHRAKIFLISQYRMKMLFYFMNKLRDTITVAELLFKVRPALQSYCWDICHTWEVVLHLMSS